MADYIIGIDQSTQGTKAMLYDKSGTCLIKRDKLHKQYIDSKGWVEHDPEEIYANLISLIKALFDSTGFNPNDVRAVGISNQRETSVAWDTVSGRPVYNAVVWQCARGEAICKELEKTGCAEDVRQRTGLRLSPYFSAAKWAWIIRNVPGVKEKMDKGEMALGTVDSWLVYKLTHGTEHRTDYSNASRTQLFNITELKWDKTLLDMFGISETCMPTVTDSDAVFGYTDFEGALPAKVPIHAVLGDSHASLYGHGCVEAGMLKTTYGTGSSIMMNTGVAPVFSDKGLVTSLAWKMGGTVKYVLEGNVNYSAAVVTWLKDSLKLINSSSETEALAKAADPGDHTYLVPAFSGLGAPWWRSDVTASITGMTRLTGKNEIVKAALDSIVYQNADIVNLMREETGIAKVELHADGGAAGNGYLMQAQSDILSCRVLVSNEQELSALGAARAAGIAAGVYAQDKLTESGSRAYAPQMPEEERRQKLDGWHAAVNGVLNCG